MDDPSGGDPLVRGTRDRQEGIQTKTLPGRMTMKRRKSAASQFAVCIDSRGYPASLELHKIYRVIPDEEAAADGDLRVVDESGEDYLYSSDRFVEIEPPQTVRRSILHMRKAA